MCYSATHMGEKVGVRELRQNLSKYLDRVKDGEALVVTERGRQVARLIPAGRAAEPYTDLAERFGATVPIARLEAVAAELRPRSAPAGTTDARLAEGRAERGA
jgi:prevent-host-death family protein